jgi:hypothetical protein
MAHISRSNISPQCSVNWDIYIIDDPRSIGDLFGAIEGTSYQGFIGEIYRLFPFPKDPKEFHQRPWGYKNRDMVERILQKYARPINLEIRIFPEDHPLNPASVPLAAIGEFFFIKDVFHQMIKYVYLGGYPRWLSNQPPEYVENMRKEVEKSPFFIFRGIKFNDSSGIPAYRWS